MVRQDEKLLAAVEKLTRIERREKRTKAGMFDGFEGTLNEHRTVGQYRAWCHGCSMWCYPDSPCFCCAEVVGNKADPAIARLLSTLCREATPSDPDPGTHVIRNDGASFWQWCCLYGEECPTHAAALALADVVLDIE